MEGLVLVAKREDAFIALTRLYEAGKIELEYEAIVVGRLQPSSKHVRLEVDADAVRDRGEICLPSSNPDLGDRIVSTRYRVLKETRSNAGEHLTTVVAWPTSSPVKHQIRRAFQEVGHPVIGDKTYGIGIKINSKTLCAALLRVSFMHPFLVQDKALLDVSLPNLTFSR